MHGKRVTRRPRRSRITRVADTVELVLDDAVDAVTEAARCVGVSVDGDDVGSM